MQSTGRKLGLARVAAVIPVLLLAVLARTDCSSATDKQPAQGRLAVGAILFFGEDELDDEFVALIRKHPEVGRRGVHVVAHEVSSEDLEQPWAREVLGNGDHKLPLLLSALAPAGIFHDPQASRVISHLKEAGIQTETYSGSLSYRSMSERSSVLRGIVKHVASKRQTLPRDLEAQASHERLQEAASEQVGNWKGRQVRHANQFADWCLKDPETVCVILVCRTRKVRSKKSKKSKRKRKTRRKCDVNWETLSLAVSEFRPKHRQYTYMWVEAGSPTHDMINIPVHDDHLPSVVLLLQSSQRLIYYPDPRSWEVGKKDHYFSQQNYKAFVEMFSSFDIPHEHMDEVLDKVQSLSANEVFEEMTGL